MHDVAEQITQLFQRAGVTGSLHARIVGSTNVSDELSVDADTPVVLASVFKIAVAVAFARAVEEGDLDPHERVVVSRRYRLGGIGTGGCADDVELSWQDCALLMMTMSDNAATDVLGHRLGLAAVQQVLSDAGLRHTRIEGWCEDVFASMAKDLGVGTIDEDLQAYLDAFNTSKVHDLSATDPARAIQASTARELTSLLEQIWTDQVTTPEACERVRTIMGQQVWEHRLSFGFPDEVHVAGKTGTLPKVRNEAGVVTYPDGDSYAVAVFLRLPEFTNRHPVADHTIGEAAALAVAHLKGA